MARFDGVFGADWPTCGPRRGLRLPRSRQSPGDWRSGVSPHHTMACGDVGGRPNSVKIKSRHFAGFCGLKHVPCMSNLLGIFVLGHYRALYTQNDENDIIFFSPSARQRHLGGVGTRGWFVSAFSRSVGYLGHAWSRLDSQILARTGVFVVTVACKLKKHTKRTLPPRRGERCVPSENATEEAHANSL